MSVNLEMRRGDTYSFTLTVTQAGAAFNLTGSTIRMTAKWNYTDADGAAVFAISTAGGISITDAPGGLARVTVAPGNTSSLPANIVPLFYDIQVTDGSSNVYTVVDGQLTVRPDVSVTS